METNYIDLQTYNYNQPNNRAPATHQDVLYVPDPPEALDFSSLCESWSRYTRTTTPSFPIDLSFNASDTSLIDYSNEYNFLFQDVVCDKHHAVTPTTPSSPQEPEPQPEQQHQQEELLVSGSLPRTPVIKLEQRNAEVPPAAPRKPRAHAAACRKRHHTSSFEEKHPEFEPQQHHHASIGRSRGRGSQRKRTRKQYPNKRMQHPEQVSPCPWCIEDGREDPWQHRTAFGQATPEQVSFLHSLLFRCELG